MICFRNFVFLSWFLSFKKAQNAGVVAIQTAKGRPFQVTHRGALDVVDIKQVEATKVEPRTSLMQLYYLNKATEMVSLL
ncbi:hypothetical protein BT93_L0490 [Corymbia citriodora subsp. variegata]|uniref:Uncharacterized protein n=1 Tax=Corymbia citriodora subsp. variegata TaxID=360336 RepID=A0A8T0CPL2_CORYI|nr:hypothetical protein BT93_L0490 [Corymbia citriodora subsp. variegata]